MSTEPVPPKEEWTASSLTFHSSRHTPEKAIDGIQTIHNGFVSGPAAAYQWFQVDFGMEVKVGKAENRTRIKQNSAFPYLTEHTQG